MVAVGKYYVNYFDISIIIVLFLILRFRQVIEIFLNHTNHVLFKAHQHRNTLDLVACLIDLRFPLFKTTLIRKLDLN